jgi:hypothetical protein
MIAFASFESLAILQAALDRAWDDLPSHQRTPDAKERMAEAIMRWQRDPIRLRAVAERAACLAGPGGPEGPEVFQAEPRGRLAKISTELRNRLDIGLLRRRRHVADGHVLDHAAAKRAHLGHR